MTPEIREAITAFRAWLAESDGASASTVKCYGGDVGLWLASGADPAAWLRAQRALAPRTFNRRSSALKAWARYTETPLPAGLPRRDKVGTAQKFVLERGDVDLWLAQYDDPALYGHRERAVVHLLYTAGLRNAELRGLRLDGLHLDQRTAYLSGKGASALDPQFSDKIHFDDLTRDLLRAWLVDERPQFPQAAARPWVFLSVRGDERNTSCPVGEKWLVRLVREGYARAAEQCCLLAARLDADDPDAQLLRDQAHRFDLAAAESRPVHLQRRNAATHRMRAGEPVEETREFMRHADIGTTQQYFVNDPARSLERFDRHAPLQGPRAEGPGADPAPLALLPERKAS